jgi:hypothetical protein
MKGRRQAFVIVRSFIQATRTLVHNSVDKAILLNSENEDVGLAAQPCHDFCLKIASGLRTKTHNGRVAFAWAFAEESLRNEIVSLLGGWYGIAIPCLHVRDSKRRNKWV